MPADEHTKTGERSIMVDYLQIIDNNEKLYGIFQRITIFLLTTIPLFIERKWLRITCLSIISVLQNQNGPISPDINITEIYLGISEMNA